MSTVSSSRPIRAAHTLRQLFAAYSTPHRKSIALLFALALVGVALEALLPWPLKLALDSVLDSKPLPSVLVDLGWSATPKTILLLLLAALMLGVYVACQSLYLIRSTVQAKIAARIQLALAADVMKHVETLSITYHARSRKGDLLRRITADSDSVPTLLTGVIVPCITALIGLVVFFVVMWQLDAALAIVAAAVAVPMALAIRIFGARMSDRAYEHSAREGDVWAMTEQALTALPVVQAFGGEPHESRRFRGAAQRSIHASLRSTITQLQFRVGVDGCEAIGIALVLLIGGYKVIGGTLTIGTLVVFLSYLAALYAPLLALAYLSTTFANAVAGSRRVIEVLSSSEAVKDRDDARPIAAAADGSCGRITFDNVSFAYAPGRPTLREVSLDVRPGEVVALVGPTGAGKSTLVSLVPRLLDATSGRVLIDGQDVRNVTLDSLRAQVSMVLQDPFLLPISIADNIRIGRDDASIDDIVDAARRANAEGFIRALPQGFDTPIGERGATLSGGQRQRIAIARALLKRAPILILDEPTSALDVESERLVMESVESLMQMQTTLVIAHRLSTVARADRIIVLDQGRIVESGTQRELLAAKGLFHRLWSRGQPPA